MPVPAAAAGRSAAQERRHAEIDAPVRLICMDAFMALFVALILPVALYAGGVAPYNRLLYPITCWALAGWLFYRRSPWYVGFCLWVFCVSALVRRLTDFQAGWDPSNPVLLAPYLACSFTAISAADYLRRVKARFATSFLLLFGCIAYGMLLAALNGRVASGMVDVMKWSVGPLFAVHVLARAEQRHAISAIAIKSLVVAVPAMALYGIWQFLNPQPWDAAWMMNARALGMDSIGQPEAFALRVFGTMNSPGSLAAILMAGVIVLLEQRLLTCLFGLLLVLPALALTQYRAVWFGTVIGMGLVLAPQRAGLRIVVVALGVMAALGSMTLFPQINQTVSERLQTLTDVGAGASGEDRMHQYDVFLSSDHLTGEGLAISGPSRRLDHDSTVIIDSGIIEIMTAFGIFAGTLFLGGILALVAMTFSGGPRPLEPMHVYRAVTVATMIQLPFGSVHVGESGVVAWIFLGLAASCLLTRSSTAEFGGGPALVGGNR